MDETIPRLEDQPPDLFEFVRTAALQIEAVAPGWRDMSAHADGATPNHVTQALPTVGFPSGDAHPAGLYPWTRLALGGSITAPYRPNPGSLAEAEPTSCISPALLSLLEGVMLVDSDAWQLFDAASRRKYRHATLAVPADVRRLVIC